MLRFYFAIKLNCSDFFSKNCQKSLFLQKFYLFTKFPLSFLHSQFAHKFYIYHSTATVLVKPIIWKEILIGFCRFVRLNDANRIKTIPSSIPGLHGIVKIFVCRVLKVDFFVFADLCVCVGRPRFIWLLLFQWKEKRMKSKMWYP